MRLPQDDLDQATASLLAKGVDALRGATVLVTGGTGFLGRWIVETFCALDDVASLGARILVPTRDAARFAADAPHLAAHRAVEIGAPLFPLRRCDFVIHGATEPASRLEADPALVESTIAMTASALSFAAGSGAKRLAYLSSGAVYARRGSKRIEEDDPVTLASAYARTKLEGESLCASAAAEHGLEVVVARCFSFIGPHIPLGSKFAAGEFLSAALEGRPITIHGDGAATRSYLYTSDFAVWLWTILLHGEAGRTYNVGSEREVTIGELAHAAAALAEPSITVTIETEPDAARPHDHYVPSTTRARTELGLAESVSFRDALRKTFAWCRSAQHTPIASGSPS